MSYPKYNEDDLRIPQNRRLHNNRRESKKHSKKYVPSAIQYQLNEKNNRLRIV